MRTRQTRFLLVIMTAVLLPGTVLAAPVMQEGQWQITTKMDMPNMPMQMPAHTYTHCLTKKNMVPQQKNAAQDCKMLKSDLSGGTVTWRMECQTPQGPSVLDGRVTYKGDSMEGVLKIQQQGTTVTQRMSGKRVGECK